jgi:uncharacterized protein involved in outer membrane biogenesis
MVKKLLKIFVVLALLGIIALVVIGFFLGPIVTKAVNTVGPKITGTKVELDGASIFPLTGSGTLKGLFVGNPEGWESDKAFYLGEVRGSVQPFSILGDHIVINEVFIDGPELVYEKKIFGGSNIDALLKQVEANISGGGKTEPAATEPAKTEAKPAKPVKFAIKSLRIQNVKVSMGLGKAMVSVPMPPITITDLGVAEGGITPDQIVAAVLRAVTANIGAATAEAAKKAGGALLDGGKDAGSAVKDAGKSAVDGVKKLFGK